VKAILDDWMVYAVVRDQLLPYFVEFEAMDGFWMDWFGMPVDPNPPLWGEVQATLERLMFWELLDGWMVYAVVRDQLLLYFVEFEAMDVFWMDWFGPKKLFGAYLRNVISIVLAHFRWQTHLPLPHVPNHSPNYCAGPSNGTKAAHFSLLNQDKMFSQPPISQETWIFYHLFFANVVCWIYHSHRL
jgi:hypothetical protein